MSDVLANVSATKAARDIIELIMDKAVNHKGEALMRFYKKLAVHVVSILPESERPKELVQAAVIPMTCDEAQRFGRTVIPFGKYEGTRVCDVDLSYLLWLDGQDDFRSKLRRYLSSESIQAEQEEVSGDTSCKLP